MPTPCCPWLQHHNSSQSVKPLHRVQWFLGFNERQNVKCNPKHHFMGACRCILSLNPWKSAGPTLMAEIYPLTCVTPRCASFFWHPSRLEKSKCWCPYLEKSLASSFWPMCGRSKNDRYSTDSMHGNACCFSSFFFGVRQSEIRSSLLWLGRASEQAGLLLWKSVTQIAPAQQTARCASWPCLAIRCYKYTPPPPQQQQQQRLDNNMDFGWMLQSAWVTVISNQQSISPHWSIWQERDWPPANSPLLACHHGNLRGPPQCYPPPRNKALIRPY